MRGKREEKTIQVDINSCIRCCFNRNAVDIKASDDLLLGKGFSLVDGSMVAEYKTLAPGSSETYSITVTCEKPGDIFVNPASLSYYATEKEDAAEQVSFWA